MKQFLAPFNCLPRMLNFKRAKELREESYMKLSQNLNLKGLMRYA
jgi:hypothetical protein